MFIYAKNFTSTATGSLIKDVTCEQCGGEFYYQLARVGTGSASAPFLLGQQSAAETAQHDATASLEGKLQLECEIVPCPHCGHIQEQMIRVLRQHSYGVLIMLSWVIGGMGILLTAVLALAQWNSHPLRFQREYIAYVIATVVFVGIFAFLRLLRTWLLSRQSWLRGLMMVAPPALLPEGPPDASGSVTLRPVPKTPTDARGMPDGWVTFSIVHFRLPAVCCECLKPSTTVYRSPFKMNDNSDTQVPLCGSCLRKLNRRWWITLLPTTIFCMALATVVPSLPIYDQQENDVARRVTGITVGIFISLFAAAIIPAWLTKPHSIRVVDEERGIIRMRFRNSQYTRLLRQRACEMDGVAPAK